MTKQNEFFIWEENDLTEQRKNFENKNELETQDTTQNTETKLEKKECESIGSKKKWTRNCPKCNKEIYYSNKYNLKNAIRKNTLCNICNGILRNKNLTDKEKQVRNKKISEKLSGINHPWYGKKHTKEQIEYLQKINLGKLNPMYGKVGPNNGKSLSEECKKKISYKKKNKIGIFKKNCPKCNSEQLYDNIKIFNKSKRLNSLCNRCCQMGIQLGKNHPFYGKHHTEETKDKIRNNLPNVDGINNPFYGKHHNRKTKEIISQIHKGKIISAEHIKIVRLCFLERLKQTHKNFHPSYSKNACKIIDEYGKQNGYNFQHAMNGGEYHIKELGYWVDGYDKNKNVVIEIDEQRHFDFDGYLKNKDKKRMDEIIKHLQCKFLRFNLKTNEIRQYI